MIVRHVIVRGRVQGVGFRAFVAEAALRLPVEGWVRNRRDGTVEAVFAGSDEAVTAAIKACRRGPRMSAVESVDVGEGRADLLEQRHPGERFSVLRTA